MIAGRGSVLLRGRDGPVTVFSGLHVDAAMAAAQAAQGELERAEEAFTRASVAK